MDMEQGMGMEMVLDSDVGWRGNRFGDMTVDES